MSKTEVCMHAEFRRAIFEIPVGNGQFVVKFNHLPRGFRMWL